MTERIRIGAQYGEDRKSYLVVSLQTDKDRSVTIAFVDADFEVTSITSVRNGAAEEVDLTTTHPRRERRNPHVTIHDHLIHLKANNGAALFEALTWRMPVPRERDAQPLVRFVSRPFRELRDTRAGSLAVNLTSPEASVAVQFDLVSAVDRVPGAVERFIEWDDLKLRLRAWQVPPQGEQITVYS